MTGNLKNLFFKHREYIYIILIAITFMAYVLSYALLSISTFLFVLFFFSDTRTSLKLKWYKIKSNKMVLLFVLYFVCQCIGLSYSENIDYGLKRINTLLPILFLPAIIYTEYLNKSVFRKLLKFIRLYVIVVFTIFLSIHVFIDQLSLHVFALFVLTEKLGISQFYMVFIFVIPIIFSLDELIARKNVILNIFYIICLLFFVFLFSNKTSILMLVLVFSIKLIDHFKNEKLLFKLFIFFVTPMLLALLVYNTTGIKHKFNIMLKSTDFNIEIIKTKNKVTYTKNTLEHRLLINYLSLEEIINHFPFGTGTGDYQDVLNNSYQEVYFKLGIKEKFNNHNQYISEALKTGILGFSIFIILLYCLFKSVNLKNQYYFIILLFFTIGCFFESYLDRQHGVIIFSFMIPLFYVYENQIRE
ncbi:O-antigen ligase family protein [Bizionia sp.]|uniref:O-antigen ligase family protein n=1 Tax=Bizionia sp. TaxID=1954480 RepID=UPI003A91B227